MPDKPLPPALIAEDLSPWGDASDADVPIVVNGQIDPFYVHGYSDKRQAFDITMAENTQRYPNERVLPGTLPYRLQYVATARSNGVPDGTKSAEFSAKGYKPLLFEECKKYGIDPSKSGFTKAPDGTCRVANQMLMVAPANVAAALARDQRERTKSLSVGSSAKLERAVDDYNARRGVRGYGAAEVEKEETLHKG